jgi:hypothetical protein
MKTVDIVDLSRRPASPLSGVLYSQRSKAVLEALHRSGANMAAGLSTTRADTSVYEFPGDLTYLRYLNGGHV